jgi:hypothetical protein
MVSCHPLKEFTFSCKSRAFTTKKVISLSEQFLTQIDRTLRQIADRAGAKPHYGRLDRIV